MKRIVTVGLVTLGLAAASTTVFSMGHAQYEKAIKARQAVMTLQSFHLGALAAMVKGEMDYDAKAAKAAADDLLRAASMGSNGALWPQGSDTEALGDVTRAKKEIWSTYPAVSEKGMALVAAAEKMAAAAGGGLDAVKEALGPVGGACKGCHDDFRAPKE